MRGPYSMWPTLSLNPLDVSVIVSQGLIKIMLTAVK